MKLAEFLGLGQRQSPAVPRRVTRSAKDTILLCHELLSERAGASGSRLAAEILDAYLALTPRNRLIFFKLLLKQFSPDPEQVGEAGDAYRMDASQENLARLQRAVESPRQELFRRLNMAPGGTRTLLEMRADVLRETAGDQNLNTVAADLAHLFKSWFNRGFLVLRRIDWRTSAVTLEKLIQCDAVHEIQGWQDLRRRLEMDRRCYAFFHPALTDEPILFIEVALTQELSARVQELLDPTSPVLDTELAEWGIFYSLTNCQEGLRGVPFGGFLIKQVMEDLAKEFPRIRTFATVSPVPGLRRWLDENAEWFANNQKLAPFAGALEKVSEAAWVPDKAMHAGLERYLAPLCAYYLLHAKRGLEPLDPLAHFHVKNGARLERINWLGDNSAAGLQRSLGFSANYVYRLPEVERNHELYTRDHKIRASREIEALAKRFAPHARF